MKQRLRRRRRRGFSIVRWVLVLTLTVDAVLVGLLGGVYATVAPLVPDESQLERYRPQETTRIYSRDGQLLAELFEENRKVVPIASMPPDLVNATIAIEDERFSEHPGIDPRGIARAFREVLGGRSQGGSTITQQLARDIYLSRARTVTRKLQEMTLALRIERRFSKEEILGLYMNQICYGHRAYGVNAAASTLFGKSLDKLTLGECALIAGLARNPQGYSPIEHPDRATTRRNTVLSKMLELGYITSAQYDAARNQPVKARPPQTEPWKLKNYRAPWFTTYVIQQLVAKYGYDKVYGGGLQIYTTVDLPLQEYAQGVLRRGLERLAWARANRGAIVCIDPRNGEVLAMVGGANFAADEFNGAWQARRQPGSSFKPIMYSTAMERIGLSPGDHYNASPSTFRGYWGTYTPRNYSESQQGSMSVAHAIAISCNVVAVRVIIRVGPDRVVEQARKMGIDPEGRYLQAFPSLALGASEVSPLEMTVAYTAFANGGCRADPIYVTQITDSAGGLIYRGTPHLPRVLSPRTAKQMNSMLQGAIAYGTGRDAAISSAAGGKTGTTNSAKDVWFIGFTPGLCAAVWVGNDANQRMYDASGGGFCAPMWRQVALFARQRARERNDPWPDRFPDPGNAGPAGPLEAARSAAVTEAQKKEEQESQAGKVPAATRPAPGDAPAVAPGDGPVGLDRPAAPTTGGGPTPGLVGDGPAPAPEPQVAPVPEPEPAPAPAPEPAPRPEPAPAPAPEPAPAPAPAEPGP